MVAPTIGSMFSGYGGLELGIQHVYPHASIAWQSEIDAGCRKLLEHHYPHTPNFGDITQIDWDTVPRVNIICGGSPCQDMSQAGLRAGMKHDTRSGLWEYMRQSIKKLQPDMVVWENVKGALNAPATSLSSMESASGLMGDQPAHTVLRAVGRVLGDLANLGYNAAWQGVRASDVGACHHRLRIFLVAIKQDKPLPAWAKSPVQPKDVLAPARHRPQDTDTLSRAFTHVFLPTPDAHMGERGKYEPCYSA